MTEYPELLQDLLDKLTVFLVDQGMTEEAARNTAAHTVDEIRKEWGGLNLYIPKCEAKGLSERDLEIHDRFNGRNHGQLAREYGLSTNRIYQIIKKHRVSPK